MTDYSPRTRELADSYTYQVNAALADGREQLAVELAADFEDVLGEQEQIASVTTLKRPSKIRTALRRADSWTLSTFNAPLIPQQRRSTEDQASDKH